VGGQAESALSIDRVHQGGGRWEQAAKIRVKAGKMEASCQILAERTESGRDGPLAVQAGTTGKRRYQQVGAASERKCRQCNQTWRRDDSGVVGVTRGRRTGWGC